MILRFEVFKRALVNTAIIAMITVAIRATGLLRDQLFANHFGVSSEVDDFFIILMWANFIISVFATSAINLMIPKIKDSYGQGNGLVSSGVKYFSFFNFGILLVAIVFLVTFLAMTEFSFNYALVASGVIFTQSLNHFLSALYNLKKKFIYPTMLFSLPVLFTLVPFLSSEVSSFKVLVYFLLGSVLQLLSMVCLFLFKGAFYQEVKKGNALEKIGATVSKEWAIVAMATIYFPVTELANTLLANEVGEGAVSILSYASRVPLALSSIIIYAVWTVALPSVVSASDKLLSKQDYIKIVKVVTATLLAALVCYFLSPWIIIIIYGQGDKISQAMLGQIISLQRIFFIAMPLQIAVNLVLRFMHANGKVVVSIATALVGLVVHVAVFLNMGQEMPAVAYGFIANFTAVLVTLLGFHQFSQKRKHSRL